MCVSHKSISWNTYTFKSTWLSFKVKLLQRKRRLFSLLTNFDISQTMAYHFTETHVHFSLKHFLKFLSFEKNVIIFQYKASTEQRNPCAFITKAFHEIPLLSMKMIIFQRKDSPEKRNTVLSLVKSLTYPIKRVIYSEKDMCVSDKSISWNSYSFKRTWLSFKVKFLQRQGAQFSF